MLTERHSETTILMIPAPLAALWSVKENKVKRVVPTLRPVAFISEGETGIYRGMLAAIVYAMPDGQLVRLPFSGHGEHEYDKARYLPKDHPIVLAYAENPDVEIEAERSPKDLKGSLLSVRDKAWLKRTLEAQNKRIDKKLRAQGLIP